MKTQDLADYLRIHNYTLLRGIEKGCYQDMPRVRTSVRHYDFNREEVMNYIMNKFNKEN